MCVKDEVEEFEACMCNDGESDASQTKAEDRYVKVQSGGKLYFSLTRVLLRRMHFVIMSIQLDIYY